MSRIFDAVQSLSGQRNTIVIPRPYIRFFGNDQQAYVLGAILNQIVFWSGVDSSAGEGWFYKSHKEMGDDLEGLSEDQVGRLTNKLCTKYFPGIIETKSRKVNGTPTTHYRVDGDALIAKIFPSSLETAKVRNPNREVAESKPQNRGMETAEARDHGNREVAESYLYTDQDTDKHKQIIKPSCPAASQPDDSADENFLALHPEAVVYSAKKRKWGGADDLTAAEWIWGKIVRMYEQAAECDGEVSRPKEPDWTLWSNEIRLMCTVDGRSHKQICELFGRANRDPFWCKNILSPSKLREKWDDLALRLSGSGGAAATSGRGEDLDFNNTDWIYGIEDQIRQKLGGPQ